MKLTCEWLVLAEKVLCDTATNNLTIVNCLDQVSALRFPAHYPGFAVAARLRSVGPPPARATKVTYRLLRLSEGAAPELLATMPGDWSPESDFGRVWINFQILRLLRPETLRFRLDYRVDDGAWVEGPSCSLDVLQLELSDDERASLRAERIARGLSTADLD